MREVLGILVPLLPRKITTLKDYYGGEKKCVHDLRWNTCYGTGKAGFHRHARGKAQREPRSKNLASLFLRPPRCLLPADGPRAVQRINT